jgi:hypothetical protein
MSDPRPAPTAQIAALRLALLFHSGETWTHEREIEWTDYIRTIEQATGRAIIHGRFEATTRILCDAIRAALPQEES